MPTFENVSHPISFVHKLKMNLCTFCEVSPNHTVHKTVQHSLDKQVFSYVIDLFAFLMSD